jgi:5-methylcytosine-specific restriction endonuclease McrA
MGLTLSEEKTKITHITEGFTFLGFEIIRCMGKQGTMTAKVLIPEKAIKKFRNKRKVILSPSTTSESTKAKILAMNWLTRGWCEYYRSTTSPSQEFGKLSNELWWDMAHWLGRKYQLSMPKVIVKFKKDKTLGTSTIKLVMPSEYKARKLLQKTWHNPYTEKEEVIAEKGRIRRESLFCYNRIWNGIENRQGEMDLREETLLRDGPICAKCGKTHHLSEVHVDHIKARHWFKNPTDADTLDNMQVLCTDCHRAKTKTDLKVLSRMR